MYHNLAHKHIEISAGCQQSMNNKEMDISAGLPAEQTG